MIPLEVAAQLAALASRPNLALSTLRELRRLAYLCTSDSLDLDFLSSINSCIELLIDAEPSIAPPLQAIADLCRAEGQRLVVRVCKDEAPLD